MSPPELPDELPPTLPNADLAQLVTVIGEIGKEIPELGARTQREEAAARAIHFLQWAYNRGGLGDFLHQYGVYLEEEDESVMQSGRRAPLENAPIHDKPENSAISLYRHYIEAHKVGAAIKVEGITRRKWLSIIAAAGTALLGVGGTTAYSTKRLNEVAEELRALPQHVSDARANELKQQQALWKSRQSLGIMATVIATGIFCPTFIGCAAAIAFWAPGTDTHRHFREHMKEMLADIGETLQRAESRLADQGYGMPER